MRDFTYSQYAQQLVFDDSGTTPAPPIDGCSWFVDIVERLFHDFEDRYPLRLIHAVARESRRQLQGSGTPEPALPELIYRLARQRLAAGEGPESRPVGSEPATQDLVQAGRSGTARQPKISSRGRSHG